ncbi:hypothetical protein CVS40_8220 [Lucilia cuprina]|nr:hypothetical protein CVS40_8220 [Lucilia cuprina]
MNLRPAFSASEAKIHTNPKCEELKTLIDKQDTTTTTTTTTITAIATKTEAYDSKQDHDQENSPIKETTSLLEQSGIQDAIEATNEAVIVTSPSSVNGKTTGCGGNCFKTGKKCKKRWISTNSDKNTPQMSEIYCPTCEDFANETPACLNKMPDKKSKLKPKTILSVESELVVTKRGSLKFTDKKPNTTIGRSSSLTTADRRLKKPEIILNKKDKTKAKDKEEKTKESNKEIKEKVKERTAKTSLLAKVSPKKLRNQKALNNSNNTIEKKETAAKTKKETINNNPETKIAKPNKKTEEPRKNSNDSCQEYEIADDAISLNGGGDITQVSEGIAKMVILTETDSMITVRGKEELPVVEQTPNSVQSSPIPLSPSSNSNNSEVIKPQTTTMYQFEKCVRVPVTADSHPLQPINNIDSETETYNNDNNSSLHSPNLNAGQSATTTTDELTRSSLHCRPASLNDCNGNCNNNSASCSTSPLSPPSAEAEDLQQSANFASTLPRTKRTAAMQAFYNRAINLVPKRRTPDGTTIYYWCDLPKKSLKGDVYFEELDDGAYNPLWASRGFAQSFHFWKENRRQQSTPLNAFLTYVTLPWWSIAKGWPPLLDTYFCPIRYFKSERNGQLLLYE